MRREIYPIESEKQAQEMRKWVEGEGGGGVGGKLVAGLHRCDRAREDTLLHKGRWSKGETGGCSPRDGSGEGGEGGEAGGGWCGGEPQEEGGGGGRATFQKAAAAVVLVGNQREREEKDLVSRRGCGP